MGVITRIVFKPVRIVLKPVKMLYQLSGAIVVIALLGAVVLGNPMAFATMVFVAMLWSVVYTFLFK